MKECRETKVVKDIKGYKIYEVVSDSNFPNKVGNIYYCKPNRIDEYPCESVKEAEKIINKYFRQ